MLAVATLAAQDSLEVRVVEGEGIVYPVGSRSARGVTVKVTAGGQPVSGASVSFVLPERGPSGLFASGGRTEIVTTQADGTASVWGMRWNRSAGPLEIRIVAAKEAARGSTVCAISLTNAFAGPVAPGARGSSGGRKWLWVTLAVAGAAGGGVAAASLRGKTSAVSAPAVSPPIIGAPAINLGRP